MILFLRNFSLYLVKRFGPKVFLETNNKVFTDLHVVGIRFLMAATLTLVSFWQQSEINLS